MECSLIARVNGTQVYLTQCDVVPAASLAREVTHILDMLRILKRTSMALYIGGVVLVGALVLLLWLSRSPQSPYLKEGGVDFKLATMYWTGKINAFGYERAYAEYKKSGDALPIKISHVLAHAFGEALYNTRGSSGIALCTEDYFGGCIHQVVGSAILKQGIGVVQEMNKACQGDRTGDTPCLHSIGHGLVGYFGYDVLALKQSLSVCASLQQERRGGCAEGAIMEYNIRFLTDSGPDGQPASRPVTTETVLGPCAELGDTAQNSCYYELPVWWWWSAQGDTAAEHELFSRMGGYCDEVSDVFKRRACYEGIGHMAAVSANLRQDTSYEFCKKASNDSLHRLFCVTGIVTRLRMGQADGFALMCRNPDFSPEAVRYCTTQSRTDFGLIDKLPIPVM